MPDPAVSAQNKSTPAPAASHMRTYATDVAALTGIPLQKNVRNEPAPSPQPKNLSDLPPAHIIKKAPQTNETRTQVLTRLQETSEPSVLLPPKTLVDATTTVLPVRNDTEQEVVTPSIPKLTKSEPVSPKNPAEARIHTYKSDFSKHTEAAGISRIGMLAAEQDAKTHTPVVLPTKKKNGMLVIVASIFLIVAGAASVYGAYLFATGESTIPTETIVPSLIFPDERIKIDGSAEELREKLSTLSGEGLEERDVAVVYMTYSTTTKVGNKTRVEERVATGGALFEALRLRAPAILLRNIDPESTLGIIKTKNAASDLSTETEARSFFILKVASYDRTFAGMLEWESTMEHDLLLFYPPYDTQTKASSTTSFRLSFTDEVVENRDVRVLRDQDNHVIMLYGYRDKETLVLARNSEAFSELIERLASTQRQ